MTRRKRRRGRARRRRRRKAAKVLPDQRKEAHRAPMSARPRPSRLDTPPHSARHQGARDAWFFTSAASRRWNYAESPGRFDPRARKWGESLGPACRGAVLRTAMSPAFHARAVLRPLLLRHHTGLAPVGARPRARSRARGSSWLLCGAYAGYAWLTNNVGTERFVVRLLLVCAMAGISDDCGPHPRGS